MSEIPSKIKAVIQEKPGGKLYVREIDTPIPGNGEVLIKMHFAPVNPSDLSQIRGTYNPKPGYPFIPGIEGSGLVVRAGRGILPALRNNKRVACSSKMGSGGTWAEYMVTDASRSIPLSEKISMEQGSMLIVNPMSAMALIDMAIIGKYNTIVNNAAASTLGIMLIRLCRKYNITLINIVRREDQVKLLNEQGAAHILNSSAPEFERQFSELIKLTKPGLYFDAVGSDQTSAFISMSPPGSRIVLYANLSGNSFSADSRDLLQHGKTIEGFSLPLWMATRSTLQLLKHISRVKKFVSSENSTIVKELFRIDNVDHALEKYSGEMTGGKVLLAL